MRLLAGLALLSTLAFAGDQDTHPLAWLAGCWESPDKSSQEVWVVDSDGSLSGFAVTVSEQRVVFYEVLGIKKQDNNSWIYTAHPSGQSPASFTATTMTEASVVFSKPDHDYPQEIRYAREGDFLYASISLIGGENPTSFNKAACE